MESSLVKSAKLSCAAPNKEFCGALLLYRRPPGFASRIVAVRHLFNCRQTSEKETANDVHNDTDPCELGLT